MTKKKTKVTARTPEIPETILPEIAKPVILEPVVLKVPISSLPVGARFEVDSVLFRKAHPVRKDKEVGQKLTRHQFSATWMPGPAVSFDSNFLVIPK